MSAAREQILTGIRQSLGRPALEGEGLDEIKARLANHSRHIIPERVNLDAQGLRELFISKARGVSATVAEIRAMSDIPEAVATYLASENLPARVVQAPSLGGIDWSVTPMMEARTGAAEKTDETSLTTADSGIAETGTLLLSSGSDTPTTLNFVPPTHIVVLRRGHVVASYEDAWDQLRAASVESGPPRVANFITGPSRTGDIEQKIEIGVHGPLRLHILLVGEE
jgi:L-lactate dehydrogenase complex protein LldG